MSVVACRVNESGYEIAADSITVRGYTQSRGKNSSHSKLFEINEIVIGAVGLAEETSLLRLFATTHKPAAANELALLEFFSEFSGWKGKRINNSQIENSYLIGFNNKVFAIHQWFIKEVITYEAIGAGMDFALAALYLGHSAEKSIETAIELSILCEAPIQVIKKVAD